MLFRQPQRRVKPKRFEELVLEALQTITKRINQMFQEVADARAAMDALKAASDRSEARMTDLVAKVDALLARSPALSAEDVAALNEIKAIAESEAGELNAASDQTTDDEEVPAP